MVNNIQKLKAINEGKIEPNMYLDTNITNIDEDNENTRIKQEIVKERNNSKELWSGNHFVKKDRESKVSGSYSKNV